MTFSPTLPSTLVIPTQGYLTLVKLPTLHTIETHPFSSTSPREVVDIAFSPVIERKGGLCAVLRRDGREVALVGLENPNRFVVQFSSNTS